MKRAPEVEQRKNFRGVFYGKKGTNIQKNAPPDHGSFYSCPAYRTSARINCYENGNLPLFYIEKDTRVGVLYAPFACALLSMTNKKERLFKPKRE